MRIEEVEIDDDNVGHLTSQHVTIAEIEAVFADLRSVVTRAVALRTTTQSLTASGPTSSTDQASHDRSAPGGCGHERQDERHH